MGIDIIVPNYNGVRLLAQYLPVLMRCWGDDGITVVDDASSDGSVSTLCKLFPQVNLITRNRNGGFSEAANDGIKQTDGDIVVLLNSDVEVTPGFLDAIVPLFEDENVFAVSPRIVMPSRGNLDEGAKAGLWRHGMFYPDQRQNVGSLSRILYATGCAAVYRRSMLEQLGGFDEAYSPFYWEDADLGYRAWKRGWKTLYQPESTVYHQHSASISQLRPGLVGTIKARNGLFFIWRNIEDDALLREHRRWLPMALARRTLAGDRAFLQGWRAAWARRTEAVSARERDSAHRQLSDTEILETVGITI